jgi:hypothetical protein
MRVVSGPILPISSGGDAGHSEITSGGSAALMGKTTLKEITKTENAIRTIIAAQLLATRLVHR